MLECSHPMHALLKDLIELQEQDSQLLILRAQLAEFPRRFAAMDERLASARGNVEQAKAAQIAANKERRKFELDAELCKDRISKFKGQSSAVKTNEAYRALQHEIEMAEQGLAISEDRLLAEMVAAEEYDRQITTAQSALAVTEAAVRVERDAAERDRDAEEKETAEHEAQRKLFASRIPEDTVDHYTRLARRHHGVALARVRERGNEQSCAMCGVLILPHLFEQLRQSESDDLFHCETCTRVLYYVETPTTDAAPYTSTASAPEENPATESRITSRS
jgi:predicted  nucleic acid-binding Zn-ribbon protein